MLNTTGRAVFVRDADGNLCTILPGQPLPQSQDVQEPAAAAEADKGEGARKPAAAGQQKHAAAPAAPIHEAARSGDASGVEALLDDDPEAAGATDALSRTALHIAAWAGHVKVVAVLAEAGASVHAEAMDGMRPVHFAAANGHEECIKELLKHGSKVNVRDTKKLSTPLHAAASKGHLGCVVYLLKKNADPSAANKAGKTPAELASSAEVRAVLAAAVQKRGERASGAEGKRPAEEEARSGAAVKVSRQG